MAVKGKKKQKVPAYPYRDLYSKILTARVGGDWVAELPFHPKRKFRFDYACPEHGVAIEIDGGIWTGGRHSGGVGQKKDFEKLNLAAEMGWLVLHYTPDDKMSTETLLQIYNTIKNRKNGNEGKEG